MGMYDDDDDKIEALLPFDIMHLPDDTIKAWKLSSAVPGSQATPQLATLDNPRNFELMAVDAKKWCSPSYNRVMECFSESLSDDVSLGVMCYRSNEGFDQDL